MRILLDENVDVELRQAFSESAQAETVTYRGWSGLSNGELLQRAQAEYDVLVTMDTNLRHQQNRRLFDAAAVVLRPESDDFKTSKSLARGEPAP